MYELDILRKDKYFRHKSLIQPYWIYLSQVHCYHSTNPIQTEWVVSPNFLLACLQLIDFSTALTAKTVKSRRRKNGLDFSGKSCKTNKVESDWMPVNLFCQGTSAINFVCWFCSNDWSENFSLIIMKSSWMHFVFSAVLMLSTATKLNPSLTSSPIRTRSLFEELRDAWNVISFPTAGSARIHGTF